jgi:hypothetical protein
MGDRSYFGRWLAIASSSSLIARKSGCVQISVSSRNCWVMSEGSGRCHAASWFLLG